MIRGKRGDGGSVSLLMKVSMGLFVLFILIYAVVPRIPAMFSAQTNCEKNNGICIDQGYSCSADYFFDSSLSCTDKNKNCCKSLTPLNADMNSLRFTKEQRAALQNPIIITLNKNPATVTNFEFKEGEEQTIYIKFHADLAANAFGKVIIYAVDSNEPSNYQALTKEGVFKVHGIEETVLICDETNRYPTLVEENRMCKPGLKVGLNYSPSLIDSYRKLTFYVVILDKAKIACKDFKQSQSSGSEKKWNDCMTKPKVAAYKALYDKVDEIKDDGVWIKQYLPDSDYWLASKSYPIKIERKLEVTGVGTAWAQDDTISIICKDKDCTLPEIRLLDGTDKTSIGEFIRECAASKDTDSFYGKKDTGVYNVVGTTLEQTGSPINLDWGGFRIPSNSKLKYIVEQKTIAFVEEKADVKIDRGTMIKNFYNEKKENEILIAGTNNYICARAMADKKPVYAVSTSPLRIDILPPNINNDNVRITYPDPIFNVPGSTYNSQYPSIAGSKHFYTNYPRIAISCQDFGQSGCASYDYFIKTGNFINIQMEVNSTTDAITALALQYGINALFQHFASKDPLNTVCPSINSNDFRANSRPTIDIRTEGQGIMCIKVKDKVGNAVLLWKEIYAPSQMMKKIAFEEADKVAGGLVN